MTKKILFLLTFLLTTLGGGNVFAADETFSVTGDTGNNTINGTSFVSDDLTISNATASVALTIGGGSDNWTLASEEITGKTGTPSLTFQANKNGLLVINLTKNGGSVKTLTIKRNGSEQEVKSVDVNSSPISYDSSKHGYKITDTSCPIVVKIDAEADVFYTIEFASFSTWSFSSFTFDLETIDNIYSNSYPYTWDFTVADAKWTKSIAQLTALGWTKTEDADHGEAHPASVESGTSYNIDIIRGLTFTTPSKIGEYLKLDWKNKNMYLYGFVTIPDVKVGQTITFNSSKGVTANEYGSGRVSGSGRVFTVTTAGNAQFTVSENTNISSISVTKSDFPFSEHHTQYWDGFASTNTKSGAYKDRTTNFSVQANVPAGASISKGNFTVTSSSNSSVIDVSSWDYSDTNLASGEIWFNNLIINGVGTDVLTFTYGGNDAYNSKSFTVTVNVYKGDPTFKFTNSHDAPTTKNFSTDDHTFTKGINHSSDIAIPSSEVTFTSSDTHVATVTSSGEITILNSGSTTIRAKYAGNANYNAAETWTYLVVNGSSTTSETLSWNTDPDTSHSGNDDGNNKKVVTVTHDHHDFSYTAKASGSSTVKYKSSNSDVATVDGSTGVVHVIRPGETWINAYIDGNGDENGRELKYYLKVTGSAIDLSFSPSSGTVSPGCIIMPRLVIPTMEKDNITKLTIESSNTAIATVPSSNLLTQSESLTMQGTRIDGVHPIINGIATGTATITVKFQSPYYNNGDELTATYDVTVSNDQTSTTWKTAKREYTLATGEFMMMPAINGNFNGNIDGLSKGTVCQANHGYVYQIKGSDRTITWNTEDYYLGEGNPDYTLTSAGGMGYIFWTVGENNSKTMPTLMIYAESPGDVILRATDSQTGYTLDPITIHIVDKASHATAIDESFWENKTFPFTWDFTNVSPSDITDDDVHWRAYGFNNADAYGRTANTGEHYLGMATAFNYDYADENQDGVVVSNNRPQETKKYFMNGEGDNCKIMPAFYGLQLELGNGASGSYWAKRDKVRLYDTNTTNPHLNIDGGQHYLYLPALPADRTPNTAYRLYVKAKGFTTTYNGDGSIKADDCSRIIVGIDDGAGGYTKVGTLLFAEETKGSGIYIVKCEYCNISAENAGKAIRLNFDKNLDVYWIALSTEVKNVVCPRDANSKLNYAAASYSYPEDLDLSKSAEVNSGVTAYYASGYAFDLDAAATGTDEYAVVMTPITTKVPANTGLILKKNTTEASTSCYMIANGKNVESYTAPDPFESGTIKNYLKATLAGGGNVSSNETIEDQMYTNFTMAYAYKMYRDPMDAGSAYTGYLFDRDWSFYRIMGDVYFSPQKSYLQIPGNLYVDRDGNIVDGAASRRAADDNRPSTKPMLDIIFEDEPSGDHNVTGITSVSNRRIDDDAWYTLQGIRVDAPAKGGIYIHNGRKVVIK